MAPEAALTTLKEMVADVLWLNEADPQRMWLESAEEIEARGARLNALKIRKLHYKSDETDLTVELHPRAHWKGGRHHQRGRAYQANFPTF